MLEVLCSSSIVHLSGEACLGLHVLWQSERLASDSEAAMQGLAGTTHHLDTSHDGLCRVYMDESDTLSI